MDYLVPTILPGRERSRGLSCQLSRSIWRHLVLVVVGFGRPPRFPGFGLGMADLLYPDSRNGVLDSLFHLGSKPPSMVNGGLLFI